MTFEKKKLLFDTMLGILNWVEVFEVNETLESSSLDTQAKKVYNEIYDLDEIGLQLLEDMKSFVTEMSNYCDSRNDLDNN